MKTLTGTITSERGSLVLVLVHAGVFLITVLAIAQLISYFGSQVQTAATKLKQVNLESSLRTTLFAPDICACNLSTLTIDTTTDEPADVHLSEIRGGCDFSSTENLVVSTTNYPEIPHAESIQIKNITVAAYPEYAASLVILLAEKPGQMRLAPISIPLQFTVDESSGTSTARPVETCLGASNIFIESCPAGTTMIGEPGLYYAFCMETDLRPAATANDVSLECSKLRPSGFSRGLMCSVDGLYKACKHFSLNDLADVKEWASALLIFDHPKGSEVQQEYTSATYGGGSCETLGSAVNTTALPYRCCFFPDL